MRVINVMAQSVDGKIAAYPGETDAQRRAYGLTSREDEERVLAHLSAADAVIMGAATLRAAGRAWAVKNTKGVYPLWVVLTGQGLTADLPFWQQDEVAKLLVSAQPLPRQAYWGPQVSNLVYGQKPPASFICESLEARGVENAVLFGGGAVNSLFYQEGKVDELFLTLGPVLLGGGPQGCALLSDPCLPPQALQLVASQVGDHHVFLNYIVLKR